VTVFFRSGRRPNSNPLVLSLPAKRLLILAGIAVSFCAAVFLVRQATPEQVVGRNGKLSGESAHRTLAVQPVVGLAAASISRGSSNSPISASIRQILPKIEYRVTDWREFQPENVTIAPYADLPMEFEMTSVRQEGGRTIWRGRNALSGAFLVTVATQNEWHAVLELPAASNFEFHISGQNATVTEKNSTVLCGSEQLSSEAAVADMTTKTLSVSPGDPTDSFTADVNTVDVLFFYDAATFAAAGQDAQLIETTIVASLEAANGVLQNSRVNNLRWHYVAAYQVPSYTATGKLQDDLNLISNSSDPIGQFVAAKCALHGVDQAVLYVGSVRKDKYDGLAWVPDNQGTVAHNSAMVWNSGYVILAHELAHNFGCHHDRATEGATEGDGKYSYGFNFKLNGQDVGTIMSYAPTRVPFFSNPDVSYAGIRLGVADDQPEAADDSRVLRENAHLMAGCRNASEEPIIIAQPQSATVSHGEGFTLSVTAAGSSLSFQWKKNGVDLPGANDSIYSKSSATETDEGVYNVVVSNDVGQASSASASVALASTSASPSTTSTSGSSGGGGGAVEPWVLLALAALGSLRLIGRARRNR